MILPTVPVMQNPEEGIELFSLNRENHKILVQFAYGLWEDEQGTCSWDARENQLFEFEGDSISTNHFEDVLKNGWSIGEALLWIVCDSYDCNVLA